MSTKSLALTSLAQNTTQINLSTLTWAQASATTEGEILSHPPPPPLADIFVRFYGQGGANANTEVKSGVSRMRCLQTEDGRWGELRDISDLFQWEQVEREEKNLQPQNSQTLRDDLGKQQSLRAWTVFYCPHSFLPQGQKVGKVLHSIHLTFCGLFFPPPPALSFLF